MKAYERSQLEMYTRDAEALKGVLAIIEECERDAAREGQREAISAIIDARHYQDEPSFLDLVAAELKRAEAKHGGMSSHHEAYAVIQEEVDEYWDMVKLQNDKRDPHAMLTELVQIAAMCAKAAKHLLDRY